MERSPTGWVTAAVAGAVLLGACAGAPRADAVGGAAGLEAGPYLLLGAGGVVYVAMIAGELEDPPLVEWTSESGRAGGETATRADDVWYAALRDLPAGERVGYRVRTATGTTARREIRTGPAPGGRFRFAIYGKTLKGHAVHRAIAAAVDRERVDFVIHTGDLVLDADARAQWLQFFAIEGALMSQRPLLVSAGDREAGRRQLFRRYFLQRVWNDNHLYYARDWGQLRIVLVDSNSDLTFGSPQYAAVEAALEQGARNNELMVLAIHEPPRSSSEPGTGAERAVVHELARRFGVELVVSGHAHNYERMKPVDGVTYLVSGVAGARARAIDAGRASAAASTQPHYVLVDVDGDRMTVRAIDVRGEVFDTCVIGALPPRIEAAALPSN